MNRTTEHANIRTFLKEGVRAFAQFLTANTPNRTHIRHMFATFAWICSGIEYYGRPPLCGCPLVGWRTCRPGRGRDRDPAAVLYTVASPTKAIDPPMLSAASRVVATAIATNQTTAPGDRGPGRGRKSMRGGPRPGYTTPRGHRMSLPVRLFGVRPIPTCSPTTKRPWCRHISRWGWRAPGFVFLVSPLPECPQRERAWVAF
jgi:hypothetical protein